MRVVGADKLQRLSADGHDPGSAAGAWLAEMRDAKFEDAADLLERYPETVWQPDGTMRMFLRADGAWISIKMNCAAGVILVVGTGATRRARA